MLPVAGECLVDPGAHVVAVDLQWAGVAAEVENLASDVGDEGVGTPAAVDGLVTAEEVGLGLHAAVVLQVVVGLDDPGARDVELGGRCSWRATRKAQLARLRAVRCSQPLLSSIRPPSRAARWTRRRRESRGQGPLGRPGCSGRRPARPADAVSDPAKPRHPVGDRQAGAEFNCLTRVAVW